MSDAVALHVEAHGAGPPLLLMHGFSGSARNFRPQARTLRKSHQVLLFDARGHARSEAPEDPAAYAPGCFVADALRVLDERGAERAVVGGLSMGAVVALRLALASPERVRALVLASFPAGRGAAQSVSARALAFADAIQAEGLEAAGARFVWGPDSGLDARDAAQVRQGFLEHPPHALAHTLRRFLAQQPGADELAPELAGLAIPTLVVAGERDTPCLAPSRSIAAALPEAQLVVIPEAGHVVNLARPAAFDAALGAFLKEIPA